MTLSLAKAKAEEAMKKAEANGNEPVKLLAEAVAIMAESLAAHIGHIKLQLKALEPPPPGN
ncbi:MAG TPA: hypothetical protein VLA16_07325 [Ideonella sp.]|jgi:hypothetical protein|nr:hypothetical protein [Ideonella sp.]